MAVRVFLVEDQKAMQALVRDRLDSFGGFEVVGTASNETSATEWHFPGRVRRTEPA